MFAKLAAVFCRCCFLLSYTIAAASAVLLGVQFPGLFVLVVVARLWRKGRGWAGSGWAFGTSRLSVLADLARGGLLCDSGLILGRAGNAGPPGKLGAVAALLSPRVDSDEAARLFLAAFFKRRFPYSRMVRLKKFTHLSTFAPTGRGKGVAVLVPNLLSYEGNAVVTDPKGELYKLTAAHRRDAFGHKVVLFDPFGICKPASGEHASDRFNPLDLIDANAPDFFDQARELAKLLVFRPADEKEPHWNDQAERVIAAFTAFVCACEPDPSKRHLGTVRDLVMTQDRYSRTLDWMLKVDAAGGVVKRLVGPLTSFQGEELGSILSTMHRQTSFLDSPIVREHLSGMTFKPADLRDGKMTVYLCLPADQLETLASLMRTWIGWLLKAASRDGEQNPVLFLLDEAGHLGKMETLENAVTLRRGMGVRLWFFYQSIGQLPKCYGSNATTFLDNIDTQQYFGTNAYEAAEAISKRIGEQTILVDSLNQSDSTSRPDGQGGGQQGGSRSLSRSVTRSEQARRLYKPEEILTLPENRALVFHRNMPVIESELVRYHDAPEFKDGRGGKPPRLGFRAMTAATSAVFASLLVLACVLVYPSTLRTRPPYRPARAARAMDTPLPYGRAFRPGGLP